MRFLDLSVAAVAALAQVAVASPQQHYYDNTQPTSAVTTYYSTMTVFRVETTVTATRNASLSTYQSTSTKTSAVTYPTTLASHTTLASASVGIPGYNCSTIRGTGALPTGIVPSIGAGSSLSAGSLAAAAVAGLLGICFL